MSAPEWLGLGLRVTSTGCGLVYLLRAAKLWRVFITARKRGRMRMFSTGLFMVTTAGASAVALAAHAPVTILTPLFAAAVVTGLVAACTPHQPRRPPPTTDPKET